MNFLMHPDGPQHGIIDDNNDDGKFLLRHRRELLTRHLDITISHHRHDLPVWIG